MRAATTAMLFFGLALPLRSSVPLCVTPREALFSYHNYPEEFVLAAQALQIASPVADAEAALAEGDGALIDLCEGYGGCGRPEGVSGVATLASRAVPGTTGCVTAFREQGWFRMAARSYAKQYNRTLVMAARSRSPALANDQMQRTGSDRSLPRR